MSSENLAFCEMVWWLHWAAAGCWWHKMHKSQVLPLLCLYWLAQTIDSKNQTIGIFQGWHPTKLLLKHSHIEDSGKPTPIQRVTLDDKKRVTFPPVGSLFHPFTISRTLSLSLSFFAKGRDMTIDFSFDTSTGMEKMLDQPFVEELGILIFT